MPPSGLDDRTALVLVDLQYGIKWMLGAETVRDTVDNSARLATSFRGCGLPVVLVRTNFTPDGAGRPTNRVTLQRNGQRPPTKWSEIIDEVGPNDTDIIVMKRQPSAFYGTDLDLQLRRRAVTGIVILPSATIDPG